MKLLFVGLLATVAVAESFKCEPNSTFKNYCNTCHCSPDGEIASCTYIGCDTRIWNQDGTRKDGSSEQPRPRPRLPPTPERPTQECVPHSTFKDYCNTCTCGADGKTTACTLMYCNPEVWNKDGTRKSQPEEPEQYCEPGSHFKDYCNSCHCSPDGKTAACTLMDCDPRVWNKDGTLKSNLEKDEEPKSEESQEQICEPDSMFKDYCNTCKCSRDGKNAACTLMACDPRVWNKDGTRKSPVDEESESEDSDLMCEPNSTYKDYCNTCKCSKDGKNAACTLMACDPRVWNKDGTLKSNLRKREEPKSEESQEQMCEPDSTFNDYCNTCMCSSDGKHAACTLMFCDPEVWNKDGTRKSQADEESESEDSDLMCEPNSTYKDYCNTCKCSKDGKNAACTLMACDPRVWNKDGTMKIAPKSLEAEESKEISQEAQKCEPGKAYSPDGCNTCVCSEDGTASACTLKLCISNLLRSHSDKETKKWGPLYKQGDRCTPRESFYSECNMCVCDRDGKSAFCTYMMC